MRLKLMLVVGVDDHIMSWHGVETEDLNSAENPTAAVASMLDRVYTTIEPVELLKDMKRFGEMADDRKQAITSHMLENIGNALGIENV